MTSFLHRAIMVAIPVFIVGCGQASSDPTSGEGSPASGNSDEGSDVGALSEMIMGNPDAPVKVIEYASVTCGHCAAFHEDILPAIKEKYIDTGLMSLTFREMPTPPAGLSLVGSVVARCAADKGGMDAYFTVVDSLFKTQRTWIFGEDPKLELLKISAQIGMDEEAFDACLRRDELPKLVEANVKEGKTKYGVTGTPSFIFNGEKRNIRLNDDIAQSIKNYEEVVDEELKKAAEKTPE